ncbi:hypothetical protein ANAPC5_01273 [Anaplasma phagocytophilum]|nr:hypothetical protein ANAPC5_01273 [Anaplasma phagocytophilum]
MSVVGEQEMPINPLIKINRFTYCRIGNFFFIHLLQRPRGHSTIGGVTIKNKTLKLTPGSNQRFRELFFES